jgi:hypothetical protein
VSEKWGEKSVISGGKPDSLPRGRRMPRKGWSMKQVMTGDGRIRISLPSYRQSSPLEQKHGDTANSIAKSRLHRMLPVVPVSARI